MSTKSEQKYKNTFLKALEKIEIKEYTSMGDFELPRIVTLVVEYLDNEKMTSTEKLNMANDILIYYIEKMDFIDKDTKKSLLSIVPNSIELVIIASKTKRKEGKIITDENMEIIAKNLYVIMSKTFKKSLNIETDYLNICYKLITFVDDYKFDGSRKKEIVLKTTKMILNNIEKYFPNITEKQMKILNVTYDTLPIFIDTVVDIFNGKYNINKKNCCLFKCF